MDIKCIIFRENSYLDAAQLTSEYKAMRFYLFHFIIVITYMLVRQYAYWSLGYAIFFNALFVCILLIIMLTQIIYLNIRFLGAFTRPRMKDTFPIGNKLRFIIKYNWLTNIIFLFNFMIDVGFIGSIFYCDYRIQKTYA